MMRVAQDQAPNASSVEKDVILEAQGVGVNFGGLTALSDVDLAASPGEITGLIGPNGAGKSTLLSVLSGLRRPDSGRVVFDHVDVTSIGAHRRAQRGMARTFQIPELFPSLTVREHLVVAYRAKRERHRFWSDLFSIGSLKGPSDRERAEVERIVDLMNLGPHVDKVVSSLPLGTHRLVEVGRALACEPRVILLDEPASGLDEGERRLLNRVLPAVAMASNDVAVILVEHDVDMVLSLCSKVYVLDFGVCIAKGSSFEVRNNARVQAAYLGFQPE
jgi:ABC-type branched-subunit amino acid transport system ATPase component